MDLVSVLAEEISSFYPLKQQKEKEEKVFKEVLKEKFEAFKEKKVVCLGMIHQTKKRTKWSWKEDIYPFLKEKKVLSMAVSLKKETLVRYDLSEFEEPTTYYVKINSKRATATEKSIEKEQMETFKKELNAQPFEDVVNLFKIHKLDVKILEQKYENRRKDLLKAMNKSGIEVIKTSTGDTFKMYPHKTSYDMEKIEMNMVPKRYHFTYRILDREGNVEVIDHYNNDFTFQFQNETFYEGIKLSLYKSRLHVNGQRLKTDLRAIFEHPNGAYPSKGTALVDSDDLFMNSSISSTKLDELMDEVLITEEEITPFRYQKSPEDVTEFFEVISESSEQERKNMFRGRLEKRREKIAEKVIHVFHESEFDTEDEEDIFNLEAIM